MHLRTRELAGLPARRLLILCFSFLKLHPLTLQPGHSFFRTEIAPLPKSTLLFRFDPFEVDATAGQLRKHGLKLRLSGQPLEILIMLLEHPGAVVTREEIRQRLWSSETFVDFEHSLNKAINKLRQALSDSSDKPTYIETLPRRGYRFLQPVHRIESQTVS